MFKKILIFLITRKKEKHFRASHRKITDTLSRYFCCTNRLALVSLYCYRQNHIAPGRSERRKVHHGDASSCGTIQRNNSSGRDTNSKTIYKNLVKQLRSIKEKRQVIIATHNATIVTNAKADQVCIMRSDNKHGWIEKTGYPSEKKIKESIINYLEGGKESFLHKISIYENVLID